MNASTPLPQLAEIVRLVAEGLAPGWTAATLVIDRGDLSPVVIQFSIPPRSVETR